MRYAVLDVDGTLSPGIMGRRYLENLIDDGVCGQEEGQACLRAISRYATGGRSRRPAMTEAYRAYAAGLRGASVADAQATAARTWRTCRDDLFPFVEPLIDLFKRYRYRIVLVSGNSDLPLLEAVRDLGLYSAHGARLVEAAGRFTGELLTTPGLPGGKTAVIRELMATEGIEHDATVAIGNGAIDAEIFDHAGAAFAFEPDDDLQALGTDRHWQIVDRETILTACAEVLATSTSPREYAK
ncbi:hypothetical protein DMC64_37160 [Amycolatopsis sp. WAC 04197]|uniref:HAD family hydrolase n=1 Tax=Amycolatopsis sp. WAC 04197 TaxID=2203199 RepID=UPI000F772298|nr:haloacid dehalogenase-like hydrolase [Amycolatopsis sp. WAC 04197]RSN39700.1 hypothetical protein DMC64_37160 [Amycolatopsis sp. WAC 04197]